jgi:flavin reductase (DIM6/NTAB) family NADH-FMN oxidoreductase RutF
MAKITIPNWQATRLIGSGPVALVTAKYRDKANVLAVGWTATLSQHPPRVGIALHPTRFSYDLIRRSGQFAVNIPGRALAEAVARVGTLSGSTGADKFAAAGLTWAEPEEIETPLIAEALAWIECALVDTFELGDHTLFVGEVLAVQVEAEAFQETWLMPEDEELRPLHHLGGDRYAMLGPPFAVTPRDPKRG